jgi:hypothetical protein
LNGVVEKKNQFNKKKKIIKRISTKLKNKHILNQNWMMKLKTNQNFIKKQEQNLEIKKIRI